MRKLALVAALVCTAVIQALSADTLDVYFIDVGHGDAILIDFDSIECLIDFGGPTRYCPELTAKTTDCGSTCLGCHSDFMLDVINGDLELAILSHNHWDHYGGFVEFSRLLQSEGRALGQLWRGPDRDPDTCGTNWKEFHAAAEVAGPSGPFNEAASAPPALHPELTWTFLSPEDPYEASTDDNRNSVVLLLRYGKVSFLLTGDIQSPSEETFVQCGATLPWTLVLKVPHHGSDNRTAMTADFLDWADPELAIISGQIDDLGEATRAALGEKEIPFLQTCNNGTICVPTDGVSVWVTPLLDP